MILITFSCPASVTTSLLTKLAKRGFGQIGHYDSWSLVTEARESFRPLPGANPHAGIIGELSQIDSNRVELLCFEREKDDLIHAIRELHPYEEPAIWAIRLEHPKGS